MNIESVLKEVRLGNENVRAVQRIALRSVKTSSNTQRVLQCFFNSDLRNGHDGLTQIAKDAQVDVTQLKPGQYVIFINAKKDRLKLFAASNVVAYYKSKDGQPINMLAIQEIPRAFLSSGRIDYDSALKDAIEKAMERRKRVQQ